MWSPSPLPARQRARHVAHRVRESLTSRFATCLCSILLTLLLIVGLSFFILWLGLRPHRPRFYMAALAATGVSSGIPLSAVTFNVTDRNPNRKIGIYYDAMQGSVFYRDRLVGSGPVMYPFFQPPKNTTLIVGQLTGSALAPGDPLWDAFNADLKAGQVLLRLDLKSTIRFRVKIWDTHQHHLHVECDVAVGSDGSLLAASVGRKCPIYF